MKEQLHFYIALPKMLFPGSNMLTCTGYISSNRDYDSVELILNDQPAGKFPMSAHYDKNSKRLRKTAFDIKYSSGNSEFNSGLKYRLRFSNSTENSIHDVGSAIFFRDLPIENSIDAEMVICMPVYNPDINLFRRQLQSVLDQSYSRMLIFIQDDHSAISIYREVKKITSQMDNVVLRRNFSNLGFYNNIQSMLYKLGDQFKYIGFCDQDDHWDLNKLEEQLSALNNNGKKLVYSDLRITDKQLNVLYPGFWHFRSNHIDHFFALVMNNVATGSTMLFRSSLLKAILPFPQHIGKAYHDHWICTKSKQLNEVFYINQALLSYIQHDQNVTGFSAFKKHSLKQRFLSFISLMVIAFKILFKKDIEDLGDFLLQNHNIYYVNYQRIKMFHARLGLENITSINKNSFDFKLLIKILFLSFSTLFKKLFFNRTEVAIYTAILINLAVKLRYYRTGND